MNAFWNFLSVVVIAWATQRFISWREQKKKIKEEQLNLYLSTIKPLSELYMSAIEKPENICTSELYRQNIEIMATLSIIGTTKVMDAFSSFSEKIFEIVSENKGANEDELHGLLTNLTYAMCCDIHSEKHSE